MQLHLPTSKAHPRGDQPFNKWIRLGHDPTRSAAYWRPHQVEYQRLLHYVKEKVPELSLHSFRKGAIQYLEARGVSKTLIAMLSGHSPSGRFQSLQRSYLAQHPSQPEAQQVMTLTTMLRTATGRCE